MLGEHEKLGIGPGISHVMYAPNRDARYAPNTPVLFTFVLFRGWVPLDSSQCLFISSSRATLDRTQGMIWSANN